MRVYFEKMSHMADKTRSGKCLPYFQKLVVILGGELIKPENLKNAQILLCLLEPFDVVHT